MSVPKDIPLQIKRVILTEKGFAYETFKLCGRINGQRIRKQFKSRAEADGEKNRLEVEAANKEGTIRAVHTRLSAAQLAQAEAAFIRLGDRSLTQVG